MKLFVVQYGFLRITTYTTTCVKLFLLTVDRNTCSNRNVMAARLMSQKEEQETLKRFDNTFNDDEQ